MAQSQNQSGLPVVELNKGAQRRAKTGHRWLFSNEIAVERADYRSLQPGDCATVVTSTGDTLGSGFFNSHALLCGRLYSDAPDQLLSAELLRQRLQRALDWRERLYPQQCYRLVYGDGDDLPGLVIDRFGAYLVIQVSAAGMMRVLDAVLDVVMEAFKPEGVLLDTTVAPETESLDGQRRVIHGEVPSLATVFENGTELMAPLGEGQKTGWFYDHRDNRARAAALASGGSVLDVFCYAGAWGAQCLAAGATQATFIDSSAAALEVAGANAQSCCGQKDETAAVELRQGQAVSELKKLAGEGRQFDCVILDPPAFIKRRKDSKAGERAYHQLNQLALDVLASGGILVSASCSAHLAASRLESIVSTAAYRAGRQARFFARGAAAMDHPVHPAIPEMNYLKCIFARLD